MDTVTVPLHDVVVPDPLAKPALATLADIGKYVETKTFDLAGLARGLGRSEGSLTLELAWLRLNGYIEYISAERSSMRLTSKGRRYEDESEDADDDEHLDNDL